MRRLGICRGKVNALAPLRCLVNKSGGMPRGGLGRRRLQKPPEASRSLQKPQEASRSRQKPPEASRSFQKPPEASRSLQKPPEASSSSQKPPEASRSLQKPPAASRSSRSLYPKDFHTPLPFRCGRVGLAFAFVLKKRRFFSKLCGAGKVLQSGKSSA